MAEGVPTTAALSPRSHRTMRSWWLLLLAASVPLTGDVLGHGYFAAIGNAFAHHAFHGATVIVAGGVFWFVVAQDVKRNGVPPRLHGLERRYRALRGGRTPAVGEGPG